MLRFSLQPIHSFSVRVQRRNHRWNRPSRSPSCERPIAGGIAEGLIEPRVTARLLRFGVLYREGWRRGRLLDLVCH